MLRSALRIVRYRAAFVLGALACSAGACAQSSTTRPAAPHTSSAESTAAHTSSAESAVPQGSRAETSAADDRGEIVVDVAGARHLFDRRLLGTNVPAWIGPTKLVDPAFQQRVRDLGTTIVRMPGGSWSSSYDWLACENGDGGGCAWTWAARPSDYVGFLLAIGVDGMWTVNVNDTAQEAAALVAFFNGALGDTRVIGRDRDGRDWGTVGQWAQLRAVHGHPTPARVKYWEIGNEVYAAKPEKASGCVSFGWENAWTCDGAAYVNGTSDHDGYLSFRAAMRAVDPTISVGAVGIGGDQTQWSGFGTKVIENAGDQLDFYVVHDYGFSGPATSEDVLVRPQQAFPAVVQGVRAGLAAQEKNRNVPVAITEYNLFAFASADSSAFMSETVDMLYIADMIGQMAEQGVALASQWNLVNGVTGSEGDYGLLDPDTSEPTPQFYGLAMWQSFGRDLVPVTIGSDVMSTMSAYAGIDASTGEVTLLVVNKATQAQSLTIRLDGSSGEYDATIEEAIGVSLTGRTVVHHSGILVHSALLGAGSMTRTFDPLSLMIIHFVPGGSASANGVPASAHG